MDEIAARTDAFSNKAFYIRCFRLGKQKYRQKARKLRLEELDFSISIENKGLKFRFTLH